MAFPVIDISDIANPQSRPGIANNITQACKEWGFLLLRGHQIPAHSIETMFALSKEFFYLPEEVKTEYPVNTEHVGYIGSFQDRNLDNKQSMWFSGAPGYLEANKGMVPPFWHPHIRTIESFKHRCHELVIQILECFGLALGLADVRFFANAHREDVADGDRLRLLYYPVGLEKPAGVAQDVTRLITHTDSNSVTLLFQTSQGLEVMTPDGARWLKVPHYTDCIVVNIGDTLCYWTGAQLKATLHRVTFEGVPPHIERQSIAYFGSANPATVLRPLVSDGEAIEDFRFNGEKVSPGITVGELQTRVMRNVHAGYKLPQTRRG